MFARTPPNRRGPGTPTPREQTKDGPLPPRDAALADISQAAYDGRNTRAASIDGYEYDNTLSTRRTAFYRNPTTGEVVQSNRGTVATNVKDLTADAAIATGTFGGSSRLKKATQQAKAAQKKYGVTPTETGHSLGGTTAEYVASKTGGKAVVFNPGSSPLGSAPQTPDTRVYTTGVDPISLFAGRHTTVRPSSANVHGIANFTTQARR